MSMQNIRKFILIAGGFFLGGWMAIAGLMRRATGMSLLGGLDAEILLRIGVAPEAIGWALVCLGTFWWAAAATLWVENRWGWFAVLAATCFSFPFFPAGTVLGVLFLLVLSSFRCQFLPQKKPM